MKPEFVETFGAKRILIGAPVRQDETTFRLYLDSLADLDMTGIEADYAFILHNCPELATLIWNSIPRATVEHWKDDGEYKREGNHIWESHNFSAVIRMRNALLMAAQQGGYDYLFMVDSDLLLHPQTLQQLVKANKPIVSEIFWTRWEANEAEMPNAWMADHYTFDSFQRLEMWRKPGLYRVGMTGACTLIRRDVIDSGVNFNPIPNVSWSVWEDRAFCIRAAVHGFEVWMDTTYPAKHVYRESDLQEVLADGNLCGAR